MNESSLSRDAGGTLASDAVLSTDRLHDELSDDELEHVVGGLARAWPEGASELAGAIAAPQLLL